jgi:hypothetical protein
MRKNLVMIIALIISWQAIAQERLIIGKVTSFQTIPLKNIKVLAKIAGTSSLTDKNGNFSIKCAADDMLTFDSECFYKEKKKMKNEKDTIHVNLYFNPTTKNKERAVLNDYVTKDTLDYALANLPNQKEDYSLYTDIYQLIKTKFPYVQIINHKIQVEPNAFGTGSVLMIVNGIDVTDISFVQPRTVTSIQVLRRTETSIYGMRGANGVIIIKTFEKK